MRRPFSSEVLRIARRWAAFLFLLVAFALALVYRSWIDAQSAAFVVLATTIEKPVLTWVAEAATPTPRTEEIVIADQEATLVRPGSGERWSAVVFVNGATARGHLHPEVQRLARGLGRARFLVVVPELPGLRRGEITLRTLDTLVEIARITAGRRDVADARVGFVGVSVGASLALAAAEQPELRGRISAIAGIAPYAQLKEVARLATTGYVRVRGSLRAHDADDFLVLAVARSLAAGLPSRRDRERFVDELAPIPNSRHNPLAGFTLPPNAGSHARALFRLLVNGDPVAFDRLWRRLPPEVRNAAERLSPLAHAERLTMPVELATSPEDDYFPVSESKGLARRAPSVNVTVTETLTHAIPEPSLDSVGDLLRFDGFVVRALRALRR